MAKIRVPVFGSPLKAVEFDPKATPGAKVGTDLYDPNGNLVKWSDILNSSAGSASSSSSFNGTTDDVIEGQWNLYFTAPRAQDAVGSILSNSSNVTLAYVTHTSISADLTNTGVMAGTYGDNSHIPVITVDAKGRITNASQITLQSSIYMPVVNGDIPPVLVYLDNGTLVYTQVA